MRTKNIYSCAIVAKQTGKLEQIAGHLRYWPFVKYYCYLDDRTLMVGIYLGACSNHKDRVRLYERTRKMITLCLKQYNVEMSHLTRDPKGFIPTYSDDLFVRPTVTLKSFKSFLDDLDRSKLKVEKFKRSAV